jgi:hypothetical protein
MMGLQLMEEKTLEIRSGSVSSFLDPSFYILYIMGKFTLIKSKLAN